MRTHRLTHSLVALGLTGMLVQRAEAQTPPRLTRLLDTWPYSVMGPIEGDARADRVFIGEGDSRAVLDVERIETPGDIHDLKIRPALHGEPKLLLVSDGPGGFRVYGEEVQGG